MQKSIITIVDSLGTPCGSGFFVTDELILTSTTVVNRAINLNPNHPYRPDGDVQVEILYPTVTVEQKAFATILGWKTRGNQIKLAILKLVTEKPVEVRPIHLLDRDEVNENPAHFAAYPFANAHATWVFGSLVEMYIGRQYRFDVHKRLSPHPTNLFSGAPVWDDENLGVIGIFLSADDAEAHSIDIIIPTYVILSSFASLKLPHSTHLTKKLSRDRQSGERANEAAQNGSATDVRVILFSLFACLFICGCSVILPFIDYLSNGLTPEVIVIERLVTIQISVTATPEIDYRIATAESIRSNRPSDPYTLDETIPIPQVGLTTEPASFEFLFEAGQTAFFEGSYADAIVQFASAYAADSTSVNSVEYLATSYARLADYQNAIVYYDLAESMQPPSGQFRYSRGFTYYANADYLKAIDLLSPLALTRDSAEALGDSYLKLGKYSDAERILKTATANEAFANDVDLNFLLGELYFELERYLDSIDNFSRVLSSNPSHHIAYCERAASVHAALDEGANIRVAALNSGVPIETINAALQVCPELFDYD